MFPLLTILFVMTLYIVIRRSAAVRAERKVWEDFRAREHEANWTRKQDISNLAYIRLPLDTLPLGKYDDETLRDYESALRELSMQPICNLNGISNTDLKLRYGVANLNTLSQCDSNYSTLVSLLANYGEKLYTLGHTADAVQVLEYSLTQGSDIGKVYELLADIYTDEGQTDKLQTLHDYADKITSIRRGSIVRKLEERMEESV